MRLVAYIILIVLTTDRFRITDQGWCLYDEI
jgi:hypothetical protein